MDNKKKVSFIEVYKIINDYRNNRYLNTDNLLKINSDIDDALLNGLSVFSEITDNDNNYIYLDIDYEPIDNAITIDVVNRCFDKIRNTMENGFSYKAESLHDFYHELKTIYNLIEKLF